MSKAEDRLAVLEPLLRLGPRRTREDVERAAEESGVHFTTLYRWLRHYEAAESLNGLVRRPRTSKPRLHRDAEQLMDGVIERHYLVMNRPSLRSVYERLKVEFGRANATREGGAPELEVPSFSTFRRRVYALDERKRVARRYGPRAADALEPIQGHYPGATYPLAVVQVDHTPLDIILVDSIHRLPVGRAILTLVMDVFSRVVLGFSIAFDKPSAFGTGMALAHAILPKEQWISRHQEALDAALQPGASTDAGGRERPQEAAPELRWDCYGKPVKLKMDNAREFRGKTLERALMAHGIDREFRPVTKPHYGAHVERLLGTLAREIHTLPGTTFSNVRERGDYDSEGEAVMTIEVFETWLTAYIVGVYHRRVHDALGMTPLDAWEEGLLEGTEQHPATGLPDRIQGDAAQRLRMDLLPYFEATVQPYGIRHMGVTYYSPILRSRVREPQPGRRRESRKFQVSYDPRDISKVYFLDPELDRYYEVHARQPNFPSMSIWELRATRKYAQQHAMRMENERDIIAAFRAMTRLVEVEQAATKQARARVERKRQHSRGEKPQGAVPAKPPSERRPALNIFDSLEDIQPFDEIEVVPKKP
ncbi:TniA transposase (plasmid) [Deinococcus gobiensis I-0]|uniref:TniA transposase n=2 Tax=Deinococcus TaxID=1298 RepID=H8H2Q7_DEIGI|nr:TniA transposase [Deinococcus gobiensis I-0]